ncbi:MAG: hypothetical protein ACRCUJ_06850 [Phocaeicola sp.]
MITVQYSGVQVQHVAVRVVVEGERLNVYGRSGDLVATYPATDALVLEVI